MSYGQIYIARLDDVTVAAAQTLVTLAAPAAIPLKIHKASITQRGAVTSEQLKGELIRMTTAPSAGTALTLIKNMEGGAAPSTTALFYNGTTAITDGTLGDILEGDGFNMLSGWVWLPTPNLQSIVKGGGFLALKLPVAPAAGRTISADIWFEELGN